MPFDCLAIVIAAITCWYLAHLLFGGFLVKQTKTSASLRDGAHYTRSFWGAIGSIVAKVFSRFKDQDRS